MTDAAAAIPAPLLQTHHAIRAWLPEVDHTEPAVIYHELVSELGDPFREPLPTFAQVRQMRKTALLELIYRLDSGTSTGIRDSRNSLVKEAFRLLKERNQR